MGTRNRLRFSDLRLRTKLLALFLFVSLVPLAVSGTYVVSYLAVSASARARLELDEALAKAMLVIGRRWDEVERFSKFAANDNLVTINLALALDAPIREFLELNLAAQSLDYLGLDEACEGLSTVEPGEGEISRSSRRPSARAHSGSPSAAGSRRLAVRVPFRRRGSCRDGAVAGPSTGMRMNLLGFVIAGAALDYKIPDGASRYTYDFGFSADGNKNLLAEIRSAAGEPVLVVADGIPCAYSEASPTTARIAPLGGSFEPDSQGRERLSVGGEAYLFGFRSISSPDAMTVGLLGVGLRESDSLAAARPTLEGFILVFIFSLGASTILALLFSRNLTKPIAAMLESVRSIARGEGGKRVSIGSKDELGRLAMAFNVMSTRLRQSIAALREEVVRRATAQAEVQQLNEGLERRIEERTAEAHRVQPGSSSRP